MAKIDDSVKKKVPELRFPGFTDDWEERKLGSLTTVVRGASPRPIQDPKWFDKESDIGWLRIADVTEQNGRIYHLEQHISKLGQEKTRVLTEPHLLLSIAATVGKPVVNYVKTGVHDGFLIFLNPTFEREFMFQWLEMFRPKWQKYGQPGSQVNLNSELVRNQEIVLPNYKEQQKIGSFFKQLDNTITLHQRKLDLLKEQKKGYLQKMFPKNGAKVPELRFAGFADDWEERKLGELGKVTTGKAFSSIDFDEQGEYLVITNKDISNSSRSQNVITDRINISDKDIVEKYNLSGENILVTMDGVNLGKTAMYSNEDALLAQRVGRIQSTQLEFIYQITSSSSFLMAMRTLSVGNAIKHISLTQISNYSTLVPSNKNEQQKIGSFFKQLDDTIDLHQRKLDLLKEQKKGFLQKMFV
ncbi:restriction endonuclease subunit S [Lactococcus lactis]|uniref:restriction endonuclease subunit S n=1 Tax=Lactococcus lactis TaxID=1358 RepID=UPI0020737201|nr:restriction endonuclease subunit S [Lactococcus lactis]MCM6843059.1 restriction endonuclease subunit S [Lactococcus lactis]MCM6847694.1 restriction endonuclease subunit S [Lactococcus lactis]MCM6852453.1 restriction endonuclease subunit S [Lactococcus lactis]